MKICPGLNSPDNENLNISQSEDSLNHMTVLLDNVSDAIFSFNKDNVITYWNKGAEKIYGWTSNEAIGHDIVNLLRSESSESLRSERLKNVDRQGELLVETVHYTKGHNKVIIESQIFPIKTRSGEITGYSAVNRDITERRMAEEELRRSEERFRIAQEVSVDGFSILKPRFDHKGNVIDFEFSFQNAASARMNGTTPDGVLGRGVRELFPGIQDTEFFKAYKEVLETGKAVEFEDHYKGGPMVDEKWFRIVVVPTSGGIAVLAQDITARTKSELRLREAQRLAHLGTFTFDLKTKKYEWNEEAFRIYELDQAKGEPSFEEVVGFLHPDDYDLMMNKIKETEISEKEVNFEYRIVLPDNRVKHLYNTVRSVFDDTGKPVSRMGIVQDITEAKTYRTKLEKTLEELQRSNRELEQFAYVASHDLQEPIRMVSNYTKLLERYFKDKLDEKSSRYMFFVIDGAKRMHTLIEDLLAYSRVASKKAPFVQTDLNVVMSEIMRDMQVAIIKQNAKIKFQKLPVIKADPLQIRHVFQNLIQNAIKFRAKDDPVIQIIAEKKGHEWLFGVKDNGIGIDMEFHEKIFVIFQRLHEKEKYPGTGIGLSICKKIIEHHGGRIWVESEAGKGTTFLFTLPVNI
ncbi:MAG: PAS domain S-box protein [Ignavibacteriales bacterium]